MSEVPQSNLDRRSFLARAAAGGAALGAAAMIPAVVVSRAGDGGDTPEVSAANVAPLAEPMVAYVRDAQVGEVVIMVGTQEIVLQDRMLASRLIAAASAATA